MNIKHCNPVLAGLVAVFFSTQLLSSNLQGKSLRDCLLSKMKPIDAVFEDYEQGRFSLAYQGLKHYAERDDPWAQLKLAELYLSGKGIAFDELEAAYWIHKAAEHKLPEALYQLGVYYLDGIGVTQDDYLALEYISQAAATRHEQAVRLYDYLLTNDFNIGC